MKKAIITGILGQDGYYLAEFLLGINYFVYGIYKNRDSTEIPIWQSENIKLYNFDLNQVGLLEDLINEIQPDEIYHLAAYHFSSQHKLSYEITFQNFSDININVIDKILNLVYRKKLDTKIFYASSSHIFGNVNYYPQTELTPYDPNSFYSISKVAGSNLCKFYRSKFGLFVSVGILYNHESVRRNPNFVTTQIAEAAAMASFGSSLKLNLRNLDAIVDWGAAKDYVKAMWLTLQQKNGDDYIISSGKARTISEFAKIAFEYVGLNANDYVKQSDSSLSIKVAPIYVGDPAKIKEKCSWVPEIYFTDLVIEMVKCKVNQFKNSTFF